MAEALVQPGLSAIELVAWLGPCIGPDAFEVGDEVRVAFVAQDAGASRCFRPAAASGKWWADLPGLARRRLLAAGVSSVHGNDGSAAWCTVANPSRFFSHRRDAGVLGSSGRMAASIWRV
jgi:copper oxidase (laccase) domain-containing protein